MPANNELSKKAQRAHDKKAKEGKLPVVKDTRATDLKAEEKKITKLVGEIKILLETRSKVDKAKNSDEYAALDKSINNKRAEVNKLNDNNKKLRESLGVQKGEASK
jgi:hypothetical protein